MKSSDFLEAVQADAFQTLSDTGLDLYNFTLKHSLTKTLGIM